MTLSNLKKVFTSFEMKYEQYSKFLIKSNANGFIFDFSTRKEALKIHNNILITCEHAGNELPKSYNWSSKEVMNNLSQKHWAYDPGAAELSLELGHAIGCKVVLSRLSRLFIDVNRPITSDTLCREKCDDIVVEFNKSLNLTEDERRKRICDYYLPYYFSLKEAFLTTKPKYIFSLHSFTDNYEGNKRKIETGVLYSLKSPLAKLCLKILGETVYKDFSIEKRNELLKENEPWSGLEGLIFAADSLAISNKNISDTMMLEVRNDKLTNQNWRKNLINDGLLPFVLKLENSKI